MEAYGDNGGKQTKTKQNHVHIFYLQEKNSPLLWFQESPAMWDQIQLTETESMARADNKMGSSQRSKWKVTVKLGGTLTGHDGSDAGQIHTQHTQFLMELLKSVTSRSRWREKEQVLEKFQLCSLQLGPEYGQQSALWNGTGANSCWGLHDDPLPPFV